MSEMISMSIWLHIATIFLILVTLLWMITILKSDKAFKALSIKYEVVSLYYRALLGSLFLTGVVVMAVAKFQTSFVVYGMVAVLTIMLITSIKEHGVYKMTSVLDSASQVLFKKFAIKKYISDLILVVVTALVSYAVSL